MLWPHKQERRFPSEWPQTLWPEGPRGSEQPPPDRHAVPASCLWKETSFTLRRGTNVHGQNEEVHYCVWVPEEKKNFFLLEKDTRIPREMERQPGTIRSDGDRRQIERSEASSDLLESGAVARVASEEEPVVRTQNGPAAPQRLRNTEQSQVVCATENLRAGMWPADGARGGVFIQPRRRAAVTLLSSSAVRLLQCCDGVQTNVTSSWPGTQFSSHQSSSMTFSQPIFTSQSIKPRGTNLVKKKKKNLVQSLDWSKLHQTHLQGR